MSDITVAMPSKPNTFDSDLVKIEECMKSGKYFNLDTRRVNKETTVCNYNPDYRCDDYHIFSNDVDVFNSYWYYLDYIFAVSNDGDDTDYTASATTGDVSQLPSESNDELSDDELSDDCQDSPSDVGSAISEMMTKFAEMTFTSDESTDELESDAGTSQSSEESSSSSVVPTSVLIARSRRSRQSKQSKSAMGNNTKEQITKVVKTTNTKSKLLAEVKTQVKTKVKKSRTEEKKPKKKRRKAIPSNMRYAVWCAFFGKNGTALVEGPCYCCDQTITYEKWHAGHIIADAVGGETSVDNLRPTCADCNLAMGTMNMFEYMIHQKLPGVKHFADETPSLVCAAVEMVDKYNQAQTRLELLVELSVVTEKEANKLIKKIYSKRGDNSDRLQVVDSIDNMYMKTMLGL